MNFKLINMKIYYLIHAITIIQARNIGKYCDIVTNDPTKHCYVKEVLLSIAHSPNQLAIDKSSNTLYFSFDFGQGEYIPAVLRIDSKKLTVLKGVKDAFALANDPSTGEMFFGGSHGIYRYKSSDNNLKRLNVNNLDIWWLFIKKYIYFIKFPSLNAYLYRNRTIRAIPALHNNIVHQLVMDKEDNMFFINGTGLYGIKFGAHNPVLLRDNPRFLGMATDNDGHVHVCSEDGIYVVSQMVQKVKKILSIQGILGFAFDKVNNIIYSDSHELVRLVPLSRGNYIYNGVK